MEITQIETLWLSLDVPLVGEPDPVRVLLNVARFDEVYYQRLDDQDRPLTIPEALEHLEVSWDLTANGQPLHPVTAENLRAWSAQWPVVTGVTREVWLTIRDALDPKGRGRSTTALPPSSTPEPAETTSRST